jgi:ATP-dependent 26S proteasome regulatory subunit
MMEGSFARMKFNLLAFAHKVEGHTQSLQGFSRRNFQWPQLPQVSGESIQRLALIFKYSLLGLIGFELILAIRDVFQEICYDLQGESYHEDGIRGNNKKAFSRSSVEKMIVWLGKPEDRRTAPPSTIGPAWLIVLAQEIYKCRELSLAEIQRILSQLTNTEAKLLQQCLLSFQNKVDFTEIGGLFRAKMTIAQLLLSSSSNPRMSFPSSMQKPSPYDVMISKGNGRHNMILWGPPGSGKSLLIRAISKHSGLPTLVISPILLQNYHNLETFFSLTSTLGSCVVVLDDLDGLFPNRGYEDRGISTKIKTQLLQWWDGVAPYSTMGTKKSLLMVAATSRPWDVDTAAWRRLPNRIYVGLPNSEDRLDILQKAAKEIPPIEDSVLQYLVSVTEGYIPLDLYQVLIDACQSGPMARQDTTLTMDDVRVALSTVSPTRFTAEYIQQVQSFISSNASGSESSTGRSPAHQPLSARDYFSPQIFRGFPFSETGYCWETALGNFYQFQIPVDSDVLDAIQTIMLYSFEWNPNYDWDFSCSDDDDDDDDDDY